MRSSRAAQAARTPLAGTALWLLCAIAAAGRSESRKLLRQPRRAAMWTLSAFPFPGSNQEFAVPFAFLAMKFVNRHGEKITAFEKSSSLFGPDFRFRHSSFGFFSSIPLARFVALVVLPSAPCGILW